MDVGTHVRSIWQRRYLVLGGALLVGLAVFGLRVSVPTTYTSTAVLFVVPGGGEVPDVQGEIRRLTATYADLVDDEQVLAQAGEAVSLTVEQTGARSTVVSADSGQVTLETTGATAQQSTALADALSVALAAGADREQEQVRSRELSPLDAELSALSTQLATAEGAEAAALESRREAVFASRVQQLSQPRARLDVVNAARPANAVATPRPGRDAVLAFLLALIVQAELAALIGARRAGLEGRDPAKVLRVWTDRPVFRLGESRRGPDQSPAALLHLRTGSVQAGGDLVVSLASTAGPELTAAALAQMLDAGLAAFGAIVLIDLRHAPALEPDDGPGHQAVVRPGRSEVDAVLRHGAQPSTWGPCAVLVADSWEDPDFLLLTRALDSATLVVVDASTVRRPDLQQTIDTLDDARTGAKGILVVEPGSRQRRRRRAVAGARQDRPVADLPVAASTPHSVQPTGRPVLRPADAPSTGSTGTGR